MQQQQQEEDGWDYSGSSMSGRPYEAVSLSDVIQANEGEYGDVFAPGPSLSGLYRTKSLAWGLSSSSLGLGVPTHAPAAASVPFLSQLEAISGVLLDADRRNADLKNRSGYSPILVVSDEEEVWEGENGGPEEHKIDGTWPEIRAPVPWRPFVVDAFLDAFDFDEVEESICEPSSLQQPTPYSSSICLVGCSDGFYGSAVAQGLAEIDEMLSTPW